MSRTRAVAGVVTLVICGVSEAYAQDAQAPISITASEPLVLLVVGAGLIGAGWIRRRLGRGGHSRDSTGE